MRIAVGDDTAQQQAGLALLNEHRVFIAKTVLLETEWVLRSRYRLKPAEIAEFFAFLMDAEGVVMEDTESVQRAFAYYKAGADFADGLHLASAAGFLLYTLDKAFCRPAIRKGVAPRIKLLRVQKTPSKLIPR